MSTTDYHTFHIPVMGLGYTIDTPLKVARYGISSVVSIIEDGLVEKMRKYYCEMEKEIYNEIPQQDLDHRAQRITAYLNLMKKIAERQLIKLKSEAFEAGSDIVKYFEMLPEDSALRIYFKEMERENDLDKKAEMQKNLREKIKAGSIDVNIMTKCDRINYSDTGETLPVEFADAMAALRGFAHSDLSSSVVFSAGMNPRLYSYCESFSDFLPDQNGHLKKKITLKVSDYRSAYIQGKFLAKKGLWVSEFRIESGLNCGGHAFPTDGYLLGPILEEFKFKREELIDELYKMYKTALVAKGKNINDIIPEQKISVQGGIGTSNENKFLMEYYNMDATGWGSPFLMVPEATNVDEHTLNDLCHATPSDYFLSDASPLGMPFNNFRKSSGEKQRKERIQKSRPGSPCYKKFLSFNTEFTEKPICSSSRQYQFLKIKQLNAIEMDSRVREREIKDILAKDCLCEGLAAPALVKNGIPVPHNLVATTICPGPNLAYFSGIFSLKEMIDHIYGRVSNLNKEKRPNMFVKELQLYVDYFKKDIQKQLGVIEEKKHEYFETFKANLLKGLEYYMQMVPTMKLETEQYVDSMLKDLDQLKVEILNVVLPKEMVPVTV